MLFVIIASFNCVMKDFLTDEDIRTPVQMSESNEAEEYCELKIIYSESARTPLMSVEDTDGQNVGAVADNVLSSNHASSLNTKEPVYGRSSIFSVETDFSVVAETVSNSCPHPSFLIHREGYCDQSLFGERYHFDDPSQHAVTALQIDGLPVRGQCHSIENASYTTQNGFCSTVLSDSGEKNGVGDPFEEDSSFPFRASPLSASSISNPVYTGLPKFVQN